MGLLDALLGAGQGREDNQGFLQRFEQGQPWEGYSDQEVLKRYGTVAQQASPQEYEQAASEAFAADARAVGIEPVESLQVRWEEHTTGRRLLEHVAGRVWSSTWDIPDAIMPEVLRRLEARLEALVGDLDRPVASEATFTLLAA